MILRSINKLYTGYTICHFNSILVFIISLRESFLVIPLAKEDFIWLNCEYFTKLEISSPEILPSYVFERSHPKYFNTNLLLQLVCAHSFKRFLLLDPQARGTPSHPYKTPGHHSHNIPWSYGNGMGPSYGARGSHVLGVPGEIPKFPNGCMWNVTSIGDVHWTMIMRERDSY